MKKKNMTLEKSNAKVNTIIGEDSVFKGNLTVKDTIRIDGEIDGDVKTDAVLIIGNKGKIVGNVEAECIFSGGCIKGNVKALTKVELSSTAKVYGDIDTKLISIDENAIFQGRCDMGQAKECVPAPKKTVSQKKAVTKKIEEQMEAKKTEMQKTEIKRMETVMDAGLTLDKE